VHSTTSSWRVEAPDRVAYQVQGGWAGIVVGISLTLLYRRGQRKAGGPEP